MKIRTRLIAWFLLVVLLMTVLALYSVNRSAISLEQAVGTTSMFLAEEMLKTINLDIYNKIEELQVHSSHHMFQKILMESNRRFENMGDEKAWIDQKEKEWVSVPKNVVTPFMEQLIHNELSSSLRKEIIQFYEKKYGYRSFRELLVTNRFGAVIAETGKSSDYRQDDEPWWQVAKEKGFFLGDVEYDESAGMFAISVAVRIEDKEGNFAGVMKALLDSKGIVREAEISARKYETTQVQVITLDGRLIYSTRTFKFLTDLSGTSIFKNIQPGNGFFMGRSGGKEILYSYARSHVYRGFKGLGWILVLGHDSNEVLAPVLSLKRRILASSLILIGVALFIVFLMSRSIINPVRELIRGSKEIARGKMDYRIAVRGGDELSQLGMAFNDMADQRMQDEHTLKEREDRLRTIFDSTETGIFLIDPESHTIVDANHAALDGSSVRKMDVGGI